MTRGRLEAPGSSPLLVTLSLLYLSLPVAVFFLSWLRLPYAILGVFSLALPIALYAAEERPWSTPPARLPWHQIGFCLLLAVLLVAHSGIGDTGFRDGDWFKHDAILHDLIERPWPVIYSLGGHSLPLVYYIAYYLPAALIGKLLGAPSAQVTLFVWTVAGTALGLGWFTRAIGRASWTVPVLFVFASGLDALGSGAMWLLDRPITPTDLHGWSLFWQYSCNLGLLFWVPHQAIAGWIIAGIMLEAFRDKRMRRDGVFYLALTLLWSPFISLGIAPYLILQRIGALIESTGHNSRKIRAADLCGLTLAALLSLYFATKLLPSPALLSNPQLLSIFSVSAYELSWAALLTELILFCAIEFGFYATVLLSNRRFNPTGDERPWLLPVTLSILAILPFWHYGLFNDLVMRASIPALFVLWVLVARFATRPNLGLSRRAFIVAIITIGAVTPAAELVRHIKANLTFWKVADRPADVHEPHLLRLYFGQGKGDEMLAQYLAGNGGPFFRLLARTPESAESDTLR